MPGQPDAAEIFSLFFSFRGRFGRLKYWVVLVLAFAIMAGLVLLIGVAGAPEGLVIVLSFVFLYVLLAICAKRLHDLSLSGLWLLAWFAAFAIVSATFHRDFSFGSFGSVSSRDFFGIVFFGGGVLLLGLLPGTKGPNRFDETPAANDEAPKA